MSFKENLEVGKIGESLIAKWLRDRGSVILPVYEIEKSSGKGPQLFYKKDDELVAPDMMVFSNGKQLFVEAKHKSVFTWHRKTSRWTTGIDLRHYNDYQSVEKVTSLPVWLMFYHKQGVPDSRDLSYGCPEKCPMGLFGESLSHLVKNENHRSKPFDANRDGCVGHGTSGMVYWNVETLKKFAESLP